MSKWSQGPGISKNRLLEMQFRQAVAENVEALANPLASISAAGESKLSNIRRKTLRKLHNQAYILSESTKTFGYAEISNLANRIENLTLEILDSSDLEMPDNCRENFLHLTTALRNSCKDKRINLNNAVNDNDAFPCIESERRKRLLVVDSYDETSINLRRQLPLFGFDVFCLDSPANLDRQLADIQPDILLIAVSFPGAEELGFTTTAQLKKYQTLDCPVVFLSDSNDMTSRLKAESAQVAEYVVKPIEITHFVELLEKLTTTRRDEFRAMIVGRDGNPSNYENCLNAHYSLILRGGGFRVISKESPSETLNELTKFSPDIILMNIESLASSNLLIASAIRRIPDFLQIPIIFLTDTIETGDRAKVLELGGDDLIEKSIDSAELVNLIQVRAQRFRNVVDWRQRYVDKDNCFQAFANMNSRALVVCDDKERIIYWNYSAEELFGYNNDEIIGRHISKIVSINCSHFRETGFLKKLCNSSTTQRAEIQSKCVHKNRSEIPVELSVSQWRSQNQYYFSLGIDNTINQLRLAKKRSLSEQVFQSTMDYTAIVSHDYIFQQVNPVYADIFDLSPKDLVGKHISEMFGSEVFDKQIRPPVDRCINGKISTYQGWFQFPKKRVFLSTLFLPLYDEDQKVIIGVIGISHDITNIEIAKEELQNAKNFAEEANRAKSEFLSGMSHELRTPMNAILGFNQMLDMNPNEKLTDMQQRCVDHISKAGQHLLMLINDILDLAKIDAGVIDVSTEELEVDLLVNECFSLVQSLAQERNIRVTHVYKDTPPLVCADYTRLKQVILNLLSNAIKYNRDDGKVTVEYQSVTDGMLRIVFTDTGIGIPKEKITQLFQPFSRLGAETTDIEGTGIGLTVSKKLVESMGGNIDIDSNASTGSIFWIELPLAQDLIKKGERIQMTANKTIDQNLNGEDLSAKGCVLYVEDNPANLSLMEMVVEDIAGVHLISAPSAEIGLTMARDHQPDLVIMDINLPGMNGIEALALLKSRSETADIPVIALSAAATQRDIDRGIAAGFRFYVTKPINIDEVVNIVNYILKGDD